MAWVCLERLRERMLVVSRIFYSRVSPSRLSFRQHHAKGHRVPTRESSFAQGPDTPQVGEFIYFNFLCCVCLLYFTYFNLLTLLCNSSYCTPCTLTYYCKVSSASPDVTSSSSTSAPAAPPSGAENENCGSSGGGRGPAPRAPRAGGDGSGKESGSTLQTRRGRR